MVAIVRMTHDGETREYVEKRRAEGRTDKEIRRCIKRYLARRTARSARRHSDERGLTDIEESTG